MSFFNALAKRIQKGQPGWTGNEITFETEGAAKKLQASLDELSISSKVISRRQAVQSPPGAFRRRDTAGRFAPSGR